MNSPVLGVGLNAEAPQPDDPGRTGGTLVQGQELASCVVTEAEDVERFGRQRKGGGIR